ncbi:MAG: xanthine dehydrogenase family protein molybdopterin-binding subunit [Burkholderiaceae bacterium]|nr:xanthine dehydrogenase family protein molybdopterin-binding subunit [Burkholderiaceae bacterium]
MNVAPPALPASLAANPLLSQWLAFEADGTLTVRTGKVELGQGIATVLAQIVADELGIGVARIRMAAACTASGPNEGLTAGSLSVQESGAALRQVCAEVRALCGQLGVADGWQLPADALAGRRADGEARPRPADELTLRGRDVARIDLPDKIAGRPAFVQDLQPPGLLHGRAVRPPSRGARLSDVDADTVRALPGVVAVVRDGQYLGVVADAEHRAIVAARRLAALAQWDEATTLPDAAALPAFLRAARSETRVVAGPADDTPPPAGLRHLGAHYSRPYLAHASIGPSCALATVTDEGVEVWSHAQGIFHLRADLALILRRPADTIVVHHAQGAGCYGHNGADDAAVDAALLARAVPGRPVRVLWSREDELSWSPFGAAMAVSLQAGLDDTGRIAHWRHEVWSNGHSMRPGRGGEVPVLLAATQLAEPFPAVTAVNPPPGAGGGGERNAVPIYALPDARVVSHRVLDMPLRTSSLRSLGAHCNVFAIESFMDELAQAAQCDPLAFRLRHLDDPRARDVLQAAARNAGWVGRDARERSEGTGFGLGLARYKGSGAWCAAVAEIEAAEAVRVRRLWIAVDVGCVVNPDGVLNQIEGGAVQTVSWVLKEAVRFDHTRVLSASWEDYPILRFSEVPEVHVELMHRPDQPSLGAGEATHGPVAAAIANAVADAVGIRMRDMPLSADALMQAALAD